MINQPAPGVFLTILIKHYFSWTQFADTKIHEDFKHPGEFFEFTKYLPEDLGNATKYNKKCLLTCFS